MSYIDESLSKDEEIHEIYKLHWFSKIPMILWIIVVIALAIACFSVDFLIEMPLWGKAVIVAIPLLAVIYQWLYLSSIEQGTTNKRIVLKTGIISRETEEMKMDSVETVEIDQSIFGRIFGFGDITVTGRGISNVVFKKIDDPIEVKKSIESVEVL